LAVTGLFLSFSMSSIGGAVLSSIFLALRKRKIPHLPSIFFGLLGTLTLMLLLFIKRDFNFVSAESRIFHFYAGINVFLDNYIYGLQGREYTVLGKTYLEEFANVPEYVFHEAVHNSYLLALLKIGGLGIVLIIFLIYLIASLCKTHELSSFRGRYLYSLYFPAYFITAFFHNSGPYTGDQLFWIALSLMIVTTNFDAVTSNEA
jgi:O-antigen ligase